MGSGWTNTDQPTSLVPGPMSDFTVNGTSDEPPVWMGRWVNSSGSAVPVVDTPVNYEAEPCCSGSASAQ